MIEVRVPDIGDFDQVDVVEVLVEPGKRVEADESLITLESEKASMDVPSPSAGGGLGDRGQGRRQGWRRRPDREDRGRGGRRGGGGRRRRRRPPAKAETKPAKEAPKPPGKNRVQRKKKPSRRRKKRSRRRKKTGLGCATGRSAEGTAPQEVDAEPPKPSRTAPPPESTEQPAESGPAAYASPSVRQFARDLGVDVGGPRDPTQGPHSPRRRPRVREARDDRGRRRRRRLPRPGSHRSPRSTSRSSARSKRSALAHPPRAKENLHRSWLNVVHVTQHDLADITELEAFRQANGEDAQKRGFKLTLLAFLMKAAVATAQGAPARQLVAGAVGERAGLQEVLAPRYRGRHQGRPGGSP